MSERERGKFDVTDENEVIISVGSSTFFEFSTSFAFHACDQLPDYKDYFRSNFLGNHIFKSIFSLLKYNTILKSYTV